ncbi:MAG: DUF429 domain-containing protein [Gemmatimonadaceae bacterium]|nr:DUF429 domain-containing protein [Gemmatimonadaceae bacterium]
MTPATARTVVAVDWSGAREEATQRARIRLAVVHDGVLVQLVAGVTRAEAVTRVLSLADAHGALAIGLDFAFGVPAWYARGALHCDEGPALWAALARRCESLLACERPFWGRPGVPRWPELDDPLRAYRATERATRDRFAVQPKSVFQVGGAGAVGTATLRGMSALLALRAAGVRLWPWDAPGAVTATEIYPRLATGNVVKSSPAARAAHVRTLGDVIPRALRDAVAASEDAFDATCAALTMPGVLRDGWPAAPTDPAVRLEGWILR